MLNSNLFIKRNNIQSKKLEHDARLFLTRRSANKPSSLLKLQQMYDSDDSDSDIDDENFFVQVLTMKRPLSGESRTRSVIKGIYYLMFVLYFR